MVSPEKFNLRWESFEANTREILREFRDEVEFFDVTLVAGDGQQVGANKLVLAGGSSFFHKILRENPHPHPLIFLKGVHYKYLISLLDFVYTGETNIEQEDLYQFLDTAKELNVKGLIENYTPKKIFEKQTKSHPIFIGEDQNERGRQDQMEQAILTGKNTNKEEMDDSKYDISVIKNEKSTENWYGWGVGNDIPNVMPDEEQDRNDKVVTSTAGENSLQCSFCNKTFDFVSKLNRHIRTHTGEKPFQCLVCSKMFSRRYLLEEHNRIHTGENLYQCMVCSKIFARSSNLNQHMKTKKCSMNI